MTSSIPAAELDRLRDRARIVAELLNGGSSDPDLFERAAECAAAMRRHGDDWAETVIGRPLAANLLGWAVILTAVDVYLISDAGQMEDCLVLSGLEDKIYAEWRDQ